MHTCPECGMVCYCGGDIDDCEFDGTSAQNRCGHCDPDKFRKYGEDPTEDEDPVKPETLAKAEDSAGSLERLDAA